MRENIRVAKIGDDVEILDDGRGVAVHLFAEDGRELRLMMSAAAADTVAHRFFAAGAKAVEMLIAKGIQHQVSATVAGDIQEVDGIELLVHKQGHEALIRLSLPSKRPLSIRLPTEMARGFLDALQSWLKTQEELGR